MAFSQRFLEELKDRCSVEEIISRHVQLKRAGSNMVGLCPFHSEKSPSFTVFSDTRSFYCFGCGAGGDVVTFVMKSENLDYREAVEQLASHAGIPLEEDSSPAFEKPAVKKDRVIEAMTEAARFFRDCLFSDQGAGAREYLEKRQFTPLTVKRFGLGYAPGGWDSLAVYLHAKGFTPEELKTAFLCGVGKNGRAFDMFRNRLMFPIFDLKGEVVAFSGRRLNEEDERKYINTSDTPAFKKSRILFGMHIAKNSADGTLILCEGAPDAVALQQAGFQNAVATLGTAITSEHARLIARYAKTVFLAYDIDRAGQAATAKGIALLSEVGVETKIITLDSDSKDPDEFIKRHGADAFRAKLTGASGRMEYGVRSILAKYDISLPDGKMRALNELTSFLASLWSKAEREIYASRVSELLSVSKKTVMDDVERKARTSENKQKRELSDKIIQNTAGFGDKINRDRLYFSAEAALEESILGIMLLKPALAPDILKSLDADCFITDFNRRVFNLFYDEFSEGKDPVLSKNGILTPDEQGAVTKMISKRRDKPDNNAQSLTALVEAQKSHRDKLDYDKKIAQNPAQGLAEYINIIKNKKN